MFLHGSMEGNQLLWTVFLSQSINCHQSLLNTRQRSLLVWHFWYLHLVCSHCLENEAGKYILAYFQKLLIKYTDCKPVFDFVLTTSNEIFEIVSFITGFLPAYLSGFLGKKILQDWKKDDFVLQCWLFYYQSSWHYQRTFGCAYFACQLLHVRSLKTALNYMVFLRNSCSLGEKL